MRQVIRTFSVRTRGPGLYEFTDELRGMVRAENVREGLLTVFIQHTSASLTIQENADPDVLRDLNTFFSRVVPEDDRLYRHTTEGPDDMPSHIRAALTLTQASIPVRSGALGLGTWQGVYVFEHRAAGQTRHLVAHLLGE